MSKIERGKKAIELFNRFLLFARKKLAKTNEQGIMQIPTDEQAKAFANETIAKFTTYKVPPSSLNTADDIAIIDNQINNIEQNKLVNEIKKNLTPKKDNVIDITDKMPSPFANLDKAVKEGNFMGIKNQVLKDPDIAREFMLSKKFPTRVASGEDAIPIARRAKFDEEIPYKPLPDEEYTVEKIVKDFKKSGATDKDIQTILTSGQSGQIPYVMSERGMSISEVLDTLKKGKPLIEGIDKIKKADGGRIGLKDGMDRRKFMKIMGGLAALPIVGRFFKGAKTAAPMAEKAAETVTQAPSYFFDLVSKIKIFGKQRQTPSYKERVNEYTYTGKDGIEYELVEDLDTGEIRIIKDKLGGRNYGDESYETIEDRTEMVFRKGQADETTKGKKSPDEYEEYKVEFDQDGTAADATDVDEISKSEIIKEVSGDAPSIKKAGGGIARMLGE